MGVYRLTPCATQYLGDAKCPHHAGHREPGSEASEAPKLPICGLRSVQPPALQRAGGGGSEGEGGGQVEYEYAHQLLPRDDFLIQKNRAASRDWANHVVCWSYLDDDEPDSDGGRALDAAGRGRATGNGEFVRGLRLGDVVTAWGMARFAGWVNCVESAQIDVYWAV